MVKNKVNKLLILMSLIFLLACKGNKAEYLFLNKEQLKPLGISLNNKGVFYKNLNPNWEQDKARFQGVAFYSTKEAYLKTSHFHEGEPLSVSNSSDELLDQQRFTNNDFYPILIGNTKGDYSLNKENLSEDFKMLPVAICMSETQIKSRTDTLVVWFKTSESLQKSLPKHIKMKDYLSERPINK